MREFNDKIIEGVYENLEYLLTEEELRDEDSYLLNSFEYEDICDLADRLYC